MKLQPLLNEYLFEHGELPLTGAGHLYIVQTPAQLHLEKGTLSPPVRAIHYTPEPAGAANEQQLIGFISSRLSITEKEAAALWMNDHFLPKALEDNKGHFIWEGVGRFGRKEDKNIFFTQELSFADYLPTISLVPVNRQPQNKPAEETAPPETTEAYPDEIAEPIRKDYWWVWALVILLISLVLIFFRYYPA